ncbi:MarR family winged helix-turn-helix transcriptional regulator [Ponticoccus alexandrii]|uniref:MarR family transcriptional regulator n=1 Tax=Ponticoccus alexandrii TaxID=1943633 RepID=A0ABX7F5V8_9RHOB|nr:MarR family transcriptional regulator [Ponticoccus alexandrii]ETA53377.1 hypothetical protein P279_03725 [Rhodobacteraceae bacterium PD-2]QRF65869.1 MarR family transcriptional regulator [Ponticoccus alexandrii]
MTFDKTTSAGYLVNHMARLFAGALRDSVAELGLTPGTFPAMLELWAQDGLTQADLTRRLDIEQATMARTLARMQRDGLILRRPDPDDARRSLIYLTEHGRALHGPATDRAQQVNRRALAQLSPEERRAFINTAQRVIDALRPS